MPTQVTLDENYPILVELNEVRGEVDVSRITFNELAEKSAEALDAAMNTIYAMAHRFTATVREIDVDPPEEIQMSFGLSLSAEANVFVASVGANSQISVTFKWSAK